MNKSDSKSDKRQTMFNAEGGVIPVIYGTQRVGGKIFAIRHAFNSLHIGVIFCEGPVDSFVSLEVNDKPVSEYTSITYQTFTGTQSTSSSLLVAAFSHAPTTTYTDVLPNVCYAVLKLKPSEDSSGFPRITAVIKGKKVYDPRDSTQTIGDTSTYKFSNNPSLCLADLIRSGVYGLGKEFTTEGWNSVVECANLDDSLIGSPTEVRRTLDIVVDREQETRAWIETLRGYASCFVVPENTGSLKLIPDKIISYAYNLDGNATSYASLTATPTMPITNGFSFDVSIRPDATISANAVIFAKGASASSATDYLVTYSHGANSSFSISFNNTGGTKTYTVTTGVQLSTTTFSTLSFSLDKNGVSRALLTTDTESLGPQITVLTVTNPGAYTYAPVNTPTYDFRVGYQNSLVPFKGQIDELRVWSRDRLETEIRKYVRIPLIKNYDASLAVWLPFNEGYVSKSYSGSWTSSNKTRDLVSGNWAVINGPVTPWFTPTVAAQVRLFALYDFINFDGNNILDKSVKFKKRGVLNVPNMVEIGYTDKSVTPWIENYAKVDQSTTSNYKPSRISMPGIVRYSQALREATERYNTAFSDTVITFGTFDETLSLNVGDGIQFHHPLLETPGTVFFKPYRITGIQQTGYGKYNLSAIEYEPAVYSETVATSPTFSDTNLPSVNSPVSITAGLIASTNTGGTSVAEEVYKNQYGIYTSRIRAIFAPADYPYTSEYHVELYKADGVTKLEEIRIPAAATFTYSNPYVGNEPRYNYVSSSSVNLLESNNAYTTYILKIYTVSISRTRSTPVTLSVSTSGKNIAPPNVSDFNGYEIGGRVYLSWSEAADIDIVDYEIKYGDKATLAALSTDTNVQYTAATLLDRTDTLRYNSANIASGERRFYIKARDSVGNVSASPSIKDIAVTKDSNSFNVGTAAVTGGTVSSNATTNMTSWTMRPDPQKWWITDMGDTFANGGQSLTAVISASPTLSFQNPHTSGKAVWCSEVVDFGAYAVGGSTGYYTGNLSCIVYPTAMHGSYTVYMDYSSTNGNFLASAKNTDWFETLGTSAVATLRWARIRIESQNNTTDVLIVRDSATLSFDVNTKEEGGIATITNGTTGMVKVQLTNNYSKGKSLILTPQGTGATPLSAVFDKLAVASGARDGTLVQCDKTSTATETSWFGLTKTGLGIALLSTDYIEYEVYIQPGSPGEFGNIGYMDAVATDATWIGAGSWLDQTGINSANPNAYGTTAQGRASGAWFKRSFSLNSWGTAGKSLNTLYFPGSNWGTSNFTGQVRYGIRNIRITNGQFGTERIAIYTTASHNGVATDYGWTTMTGSNTIANLILQAPNCFDVYLLNASSGAKLTGQVSWVFRGM
jgi:hypothetical protein